MTVLINGSGYIGTNNNIYTDSNGRVGIGTSTPANLLEIAGDAANIYLRSNNSGDATLRYMGAAAERATVRATSSNNLLIETAGIERFRIDSSGYVTKPYQPAFHATSGSGATAGGSVMVFISVLTNISSSYNSSTGRFTAPIAGTYAFFCSYLKDGGNTDTYTSIRKNGSAYANMDCTGSNYTPGSLQAIITMAAGDYVDVYVNGGTVYQSYRQFSGYLLG